MAIETGDLLVLQKNGGGELRKATVQALLATIPDAGTPTLDAVTTAGNNSTTSIFVGPDGDTKIVLNADGNLTADETVAGKTLAATEAITAGTTIQATDSVTAGTDVFAGSPGGTQIKLDGTTGEVGGGSAVFIDGGSVALGGDEVDYA